MALIIITDLGTKPCVGKSNNTERWCISECPYCGKREERRMSSAKKVQSCGCAGFLKTHFKHAKSGTREYQIWADMKSRCDNVGCNSYIRYGGRGITYDSEWETFEGFWKDMEDGYRDNLTIDRKDTNGNYNKDNCRWITRTEQAKNRNPLGTFKKRDLSTYYRKIDKEELTKLREEYSLLKYGKKIDFAKKVSAKFNISLNTVKKYLAPKGVR